MTWHGRVSKAATLQWASFESSAVSAHPCTLVRLLTLTLLAMVRPSTAIPAHLTL